MSNRYTTTVIATPDPPPVGIPNPIHADDGAAAAGYQGALVAGVRTYGWVANAVRALVGRRWLSEGWADITLRRPLFTGETLQIDVDPAPDINLSADATLSASARPVPAGEFGPAVPAHPTHPVDPERWSVRAGVGVERVVLDGEVGVGRAPWLADIDPPTFAPAADPPPMRPTYTLGTVPYGMPLRPLGAFITEEAAHRLATVDLGLAHSDLPEGVVHPWFLAARMAPLTRHNFTYGPTIHVRTQIQHRAEVQAGQQLIIGARIVSAHERNGHWYQVLDGMVSTAEGTEVARLRHTTIFRPRGTVTPPPIVGDPTAANSH